MKLYCSIKQSTNEDGKTQLVIAEGPCELPKNSQNVSNLDLLSDAELISLGWVPVEEQTDNKPVFVSVSYIVSATKVIAKFVTRDKTVEEISTEKEDKSYYQWQQVRQQRNSLLDASDKLVVVDKWEKLSTEEKDKIAVYRQALRDLPASYIDPFSVIYPIL